MTRSDILVGSVKAMEFVEESNLPREKKDFVLDSLSHFSRYLDDLWGIMIDIYNLSKEQPSKEQPKIIDEALSRVAIIMAIAFNEKDYFKSLDLSKKTKKEQ